MCEGEEPRRGLLPSDASGVVHVYERNPQLLQHETQRRRSIRELLLELIFLFSFQ